MMTLYEELLFGGVKIEHHESDLYFPVTRKSTEILRRHPKAMEIAEYFTNRISGDTWVDVPFNYQPYWESKARIV